MVLLLIWLLLKKRKKKRLKQEKTLSNMQSIELIAKELFENYFKKIQEHSGISLFKIFLEFNTKLYGLINFHKPILE